MFLYFFVSIYISLLDLPFPLLAFETLLFSYDIPYILVKCTCPKRYLNGLSCKTRWSWSSSSMALTWLYTLYNCVLASEMFRDAQQIWNYICNLRSLFVISCYALCSLSDEDTRNIWTITVKYWQIHTSIGRFIYPITTSSLHHTGACGVIHISQAILSVDHYLDIRPN